MQRQLLMQVKPKEKNSFQEDQRLLVWSQQSLSILSNLLNKADYQKKQTLVQTKQPNVKEPLQPHKENNI